MKKILITIFVFIITFGIFSSSYVQSNILNVLIKSGIENNQILLISKSNFSFVQLKTFFETHTILELLSDTEILKEFFKVTSISQ